MGDLACFPWRPSSARQPHDQASQSLRGAIPRERRQFGCLVPWIEVQPGKRRENAEHHLVSLHPDRRVEKAVELGFGEGNRGSGSHDDRQWLCWHLRNASEDGNLRTRRGPVSRRRRRSVKRRPGIPRGSRAAEVGAKYTQPPLQAACDPPQERTGRALLPRFGKYLPRIFGRQNRTGALPRQQRVWKPDNGHREFPGSTSRCDRMRSSSLREVLYTLRCVEVGGGADA